MNEQSEIKSEERTEKLKPFLHKIFQKILNVQAKQKDFILSDLFPFQLIIEEKGEDKKKLLLENNINSEELISEMHEILFSDQHLQKCCVTVNRLAMWLDEFIAKVFRLSPDAILNDEKFEEVFNEFSNITYSKPFKAVVCSHIFNFNSKIEVLDFEELKIQKLDMAERSRIFNDHSTFYFLHPYSDIGDYFIISNNTELIENDWNWLIEEREKAEWLSRVFQYFKDGLIHINYSAVHFYPEWINPIRQGGVFLTGEKRKFPYEHGEKMYSLDGEEYKNLIKWWEMFCKPKIFQMFDGERNNLGKVIQGAGNYYESSFEQSEDIRKLVDLSITLESLFSPYNQNEISFQLSQLAAQFIGETVDEKQQIFNDVKNIYGKRSKLLHGSSQAHNEGFITINEIENFASILRRGLLKFITLYIRGEENHKAIIERVRESLFNPKIRRSLKRDSDIARLIKAETQTNI